MTKKKKSSLWSFINTMNNAIGRSQTPGAVKKRKERKRKRNKLW